MDNPSRRQRRGRLCHRLCRWREREAVAALTPLTPTQVQAARERMEAEVALAETRHAERLEAADALGRPELAPPLPVRVSDLTVLLAALDQAAAALGTYREYDTRITEQMGEAVHTAFRKGCEDGMGVWSAIGRLPGKEYGNAISFVVRGLQYGLEKRLAEARTAAQAHALITGEK